MGKDTPQLEAYKSAFLLFAIIIVSLILLRSTKNPAAPEKKMAIVPVSTPTPTPTPFLSFVQPRLPVKTVYTVVLLGDSMTAALGPHGGLFSEYMNTAYKEKGNAGIIVDNYAVPSTNIQSVQKRFTEPLDIDGRKYPGLRDRKDVDLIIIESFAYNPMSQMASESAALEHHRQLKNLLMEISQSLPNTRVALMSTIAPSKRRYALGVQTITQSDREIQVAERVNYLKRFVDLAGMYGLPIINVYEESLTSDGDGDLRYINPDDNIHPSFEGIRFISRAMTDFIVSERLLPLTNVPQ